MPTPRHRWRSASGSSKHTIRLIAALCHAPRARDDAVGTREAKRGRPQAAFPFSYPQIQGSVQAFLALNPPDIVFEGHDDRFCRSALDKLVGTVILNEPDTNTGIRFGFDLNLAQAQLYLPFLADTLTTLPGPLVAAKTVGRQEAFSIGRQISFHIPASPRLRPLFEGSHCCLPGVRLPLLLGCG